MKNLLLAATALAFIAGPASATLQLSANINGVIFSCADGAACDTNPLANQLKIADQTFAGVEIQGSSQLLVAGPTNTLNTSSFQIINHNLTAATIELAINGINFFAPVSSYSASGAGTWQNANGSTATLTFYGDVTNTQGANSPGDLPGVLLNTFSDVASGPADSFSTGALSGLFSASGPFGMSLGTSGTLAAWNGIAGQETTLVGRSQALVTIVDAPEPMSIALLGAGLIGLGVARRKRVKVGDVA